MSKIIFIEPKAPNLHIFSKFPLPRLGTILLGTIARDEGWDAAVIVEERKEIDWDEIATADIVGISTITSTAPRAFAIADRVQKLGIPVILGGPHVSFLPDEALEHSDFLIRGEAEGVFPLFLETLKNNGDFSVVPNLSFKKNQTVIHNKITAEPTDMNMLPYPEFSIIQGKPKRIGGKYIIPVQTSRGCPYNCSFCSVTGMFGRKYRFRSVEHIIGELRRYNDGKNFVFFYDDNFGANRKRLIDLLDAMIAENFKFKWSTQVRADITKDEELIKKMRKSGCHTVFIGFESVNPASLKAMNKCQSVEGMEHAAQVFKRNKINVHGMFVVGVDDDNPDSVKASVKFAKRNWLSSVQFLILTPLPGTRCYNDLCKAGRITFKDWSLYDAHHVVFKPIKFSLADLQKAQMKAHEQFYSLYESIRRLMHFRFVDVGIAHYARHLNFSWRRKNKMFLKLLDLLKPRKGARIIADYEQEIALDTNSTH